MTKSGQEKSAIKYEEIKPIEELKHLVHSYWMHQNMSDQPNPMTIVPDSFFKIIFLIKNGKIVNYFMTGLWTQQKEFNIPPITKVIGCRLKILAPEYLLNHQIDKIIDSHSELSLNFLNLKSVLLSDFKSIIRQIETEFLKIKSKKDISANKLRLSDLLYLVKGDISVSEVSKQIFWSERQINRYMKKYLGVSLKAYLNIQKCYISYLNIRDGEFYPDANYYDQAHYIREIKKHTGETPKVLFQKKNDRFIQLKHIKPK